MAKGVTRQRMTLLEALVGGPVGGAKFGLPDNYKVPDSDNPVCVKCKRTWGYHQDWKCPIMDDDGMIWGFEDDE